MLFRSRAYYPGKDFDYAALDSVHDPGMLMKIPLTVFSLLIIVMGIYSVPLMQFLEKIASGWI